MSRYFRQSVFKAAARRIILELKANRSFASEVDARSFLYLEQICSMPPMFPGQDAFRCNEQMSAVTERLMADETRMESTIRHSSSRVEKTV